MTHKQQQLSKILIYEQSSQQCVHVHATSPTAMCSGCHVSVIFHTTAMHTLVIAFYWFKDVNLARGADKHTQKCCLCVNQPWYIITASCNICSPSAGVNFVFCNKHAVKIKIFEETTGKQMCCSNEQPICPNVTLCGWSLVKLQGGWSS